MHTTTLCASLIYDLSRVESAYHNAYIYTSMIALMGDPGVWTLVSFKILIDKLTWGWYQRQPLPTALQQLLLPVNRKGETKINPSAIATRMH